MTLPPHEPAAPTEPRPAPVGAGPRLRALTDFAKALSRVRWSDDVLTVVATEALRALEADSLSLSQWEREAGWLRTLVNVGELARGEEPRPTSEIYPVTAFPEQWALLEDGQPYVVRRAGAGPPRSRLEALLVEAGKASAVGVPLVVEGQVWGELYAARRPDRPAFAAEDLDFATAVAVQVSAGVAQAEHLARVERLAYSDALTGLANRRLLEDALDKGMERHVAEGAVVTVLVADVNELKAINDELGHEAGDVALCAFASILSALVADLPGALAARLGGDEFCVLAIGPTSDDMLVVADRLCQQARRTLPAGISCGIASTTDLPDTVASGPALLRVADAAQYRAKRGGLAVPVVAGRHLTPASDGPAHARPARDAGRRADVRMMLDAVLRALDGIDPRRPAARVAAVVAEVARLADASSWWVSELPAGSDRFFTRASAISRLPHRYRSEFVSFYDEPDGYPVADFPASLAAARGGLVVVEADDPEADPAEAALLGLGGFSQMVMAGDQDATGGYWLAEVFVDELSVPVREFALAMRGAVSLALAAPADEAPMDEAGTRADEIGTRSA